MTSEVQSCFVSKTVSGHILSPDKKAWSWMTCASEEFVDLEVAVIFLTVLLHRWQALHLTLLGPTESAAGAVLLMDCQPGDSLITTLCFSLMERDKRLIGTDVISEIA